MGSQHSQQQTAVVKLTAQGKLLTVKPIHPLQSTPARGDRQESNEFTPRARLNLMRTFARIEAPDSKGYRSRVSMLTLTMLEIVHPREAKRLFFVFLKRWRRKYPKLSGIWKMEFQKRGAPHFHMILYNAGYIKKEHIRDAWGEVIGQDKPFTRIERIHNYRQGMSYVAKYLGKQDDTGFINGSNLTADDESIGRRWGVFNRLNIPWAEKIDSEVPLVGSWWLIRSYCSKFWSVLEEPDYLGFSLFLDDAKSGLDYIVSLSRQFIAVS